MHLHDNKELFKEILERTAEAERLPEDIVEKDYYVYIILRQIHSLRPDAVFKGGTSLSKCYNVIKRFSEDIDLTFTTAIKKDRRSKEIKHKTIMAASEHLSFPIPNINETEGDWDVCRYDFQTPAVADYAVSGMRPQVTLETSFLSPCENPESKDIDSYIFRFLKKQFPEQLAKYDIAPFSMKVQPMEITFIDKIYALCDYYLENKIEKHSRHLYDIHKMRPHIKFDKKFKDLAKEIRAHRETLEKAYSVRQPKPIAQLAEEIIQKDIFKSDYNDRTTKLISENGITYDTVIGTFKEITSYDLF